MAKLLLPLMLCAAIAAPARAACTINSISGASFGNYNPYSTTALTTTITGKFSCTSNATVTISTGSSGTYTTRTMRNGANVLNYNLYLDAGYTIVLGDGSPGAASYNVGPGNNQPFQVYGKTPPQQDVAVDSDSIVVTFTF